ncbi:hypothetical protein EJ08DRAFT_664422 [Tothia fuscella]|uniref:Uncharacterized protein n=1 Tax=Tothia fuscella TaxID=1048955 RepID=A0A9P4NIZ8_9PEZI|nr:hypothetical protein EJ08DRAFT_664422 [Tothia fuscella]
MADITFLHQLGFNTANMLQNLPILRSVMVYVCAVMFFCIWVFENRADANAAIGLPYEYEWDFMFGVFVTHCLACCAVQAIWAIDIVAIKDHGKFYTYINKVMKVCYVVILFHSYWDAHHVLVDNRHNSQLFHWTWSLHSFLDGYVNTCYLAMYAHIAYHCKVWYNEYVRPTQIEDHTVAIETTPNLHPPGKAEANLNALMVSFKDQLASKDQVLQTKDTEIASLEETKKVQDAEVERLNALLKAKDIEVNTLTEMNKALVKDKDNALRKAANFEHINSPQTNTLSPSQNGLETMQALLTKRAAEITALKSEIVGLKEGDTAMSDNLIFDHCVKWLGKQEKLSDVDRRKLCEKSKLHDLWRRYGVLKDMRAKTLTSVNKHFLNAMRIEHINCQYSLTRLMWEECLTKLKELICGNGDDATGFDEVRDILNILRESMENFYDPKDKEAGHYDCVFVDDKLRRVLFSMFNDVVSEYGTSPAWEDKLRPEVAQDKQVMEWLEYVAKWRKWGNLEGNRDILGLFKSSTDTQLSVVRIHGVFFTSIFLPDGYCTGSSSF